MKENPIKAQVSATKTTGLHNDFSEQEEVMTASAMPPKFALTASAAEDDNQGSQGRMVIPFEGFGGSAELDQDRTNTFLGRCIEGATKDDMIQNMDRPLGTNYFRYQPEAMVGKNKGGINVLDVADGAWSWPINNAWLQAAVDRGDRIRFISDPKDPTTLYREGDPEKGPTITGQELGVLMYKGFAPDENSGEVQKDYVPQDEDLWERWQSIKDIVIAKNLHEGRDEDAYQHFLYGSQVPNRAAREFKTPTGDIVATQTNFFGGKPTMQAVG